MTREYLQGNGSNPPPGINVTYSPEFGGAPGSTDPLLLIDKVVSQEMPALMNRSDYDETVWTFLNSPAPMVTTA